MDPSLWTCIICVFTEYQVPGEKLHTLILHFSDYKTHPHFPPKLGGGESVSYSPKNTVVISLLIFGKSIYFLGP